MKLLSTPFLLIALLGLPQATFAIPAAVAEAAANPEVGSSLPKPKLKKRLTTYCTVTGDGVRYRTCAATSCTAMGQYPINTRAEIDCFVNGENVNGRM